MKGGLHVLNLPNTHRQLLPVRGCKTGLEEVERERKREIEMWRGAEALYPPCKAHKYTTRTHMNMHFKMSIFKKKFDIRHFLYRVNFLKWDLVLKKKEVESSL